MGIRTQLARALVVIFASLVSGATVATDGRTLTDDKCVSTCDEESDKCMLSSGHDQNKQKQCDSTYEECLKKCG
jgi:hypothetical protein